MILQTDFISTQRQILPLLHGTSRVHLCKRMLCISHHLSHTLLVMVGPILGTGYARTDELSRSLWVRIALSQVQPSRIPSAA